MDLLSSFQFLATAAKAAQTPESLKFRDLPPDTRPFAALMQVPSGTGEAAPQTIGQRLVLPGDAGKGLPVSGDSLPPGPGAATAAPDVKTLQMSGEHRSAAVVGADAAPGFFGKNRIEAFAAPDPRSDAPADVPDRWSGGSDDIREESWHANRLADRPAAHPTSLRTAPGSALPKDSAGIHLSTGALSAPVTVLVPSGDGVGSTAPHTPALVPADHRSRAVQDAALSKDSVAHESDHTRLPGHGAGVSLDDFPRNARAVLPGETGEYPSPAPNATTAPRDAAMPAATSAPGGHSDATADRDTASVPVLRRKVRILAAQGALDTRVELARTPVSYASATGPVRPSETGDPSATHRAQALVDAMPGIRTHKRIAVPPAGIPAPASTIDRTADAPLPGMQSTANQTRPQDAALNPMRTGRAAPPDVAAAVPRSFSGLAEQARPELSSSQVNSPTDSGQPNKPEGPAVTQKNATTGSSQMTSVPADQAQRAPKPAPAANISRTDGPNPNAQPIGGAMPASSERAIAANPDGFAMASFRPGAPAAGQRPDASPVAPRNAPPTLTDSARTNAMTTGERVIQSAAPAPAARLAETLGRNMDKTARTLPAGIPRFVTEQGSAVESVRIVTTDNTFATGAPASGSNIVASENAAPTYRLPAAPGSERWNQALGERVVLMMRGEQQLARLVLNPEHLGALEVQIKVKDEQAQVWLQAQSPQAREALENALPRLREMLAEQGLDLARDHGSEQRRAYERTQDSQPRADADNRQQAATDDAPGNDGKNRRGGHDGLIDRYI